MSSTRCLPKCVEVVADHPIDVAGEPLRGARAPEIAQRIEPDDRNAVLGERLRDFLVEARPAAVAGQDDGEEVRRRRARPGGDLDDRQVAERDRRERGRIPRRALRQSVEGGRGAQAPIGSSSRDHPRGRRRRQRRACAQ